MSDHGFFRRWARLKAGDKDAGPPPAGPGAELPPLAQNLPHPAVGPVPAPAAGAPQRPPPTLDDVALLGADSDFSAFVTQGVDKAVQRLAMKKLFSDPHFRLTDGLDVYIDDYTGADPVSAAMLASLRHARSALARAMQDDDPPPAPSPPDPESAPGDEPPQSPQGKA
jgi:hypothetical protein